tara:strand:+ start:145 stop:840 length:696 start_codon:yes stop_codon:yes gene_type:complete
MANNNELENILSEFDFDKSSENYEKINKVPSKSVIEGFLYIANRPDFQPSMVDSNTKEIIFAIYNEVIQSEIKFSTLGTYFYALGVQLFRLSCYKKINPKNLLTSKELFEWSIAIDEKYYQAYNRLGDCYVAINEHKVAISCFKYSLKNIGSGGMNDLSIFKGGHGDAFEGDNYLKIGLSLLELDRVNDAKIFILKSKEYFKNDDELRDGSNIKYSSWKEIMELLVEKNEK